MKPLTRLWAYSFWLQSLANSGRPLGYNNVDWWLET